MAPQNLSFIETESEKEDKNGGGGTSDEREAVATGRESRSLTPSDPLKRLPERLSQLNISSGSKTYRVHNAASTPSQSEKEQSPSPTRGAAPVRPTISSTFKQSRRSGSAEPGQPGAGMPASGPSSLRSNSGAGIQLTEEEAETLAAMKTERLKDDADASKGFVISFDDEPAKKAKPALKVRRPSKKFSSASGHDLNSDGSSSSRKENVPPELMICIDMNMGSDEGAGGGGGGGPSSSVAGTAGASSPSRRKYVSSTRIGNSPPPPADTATRRSDWKSYDDPHQSATSLGHMGQPANDPDHELTPTSSGGEPIPKFAVDPSVPLEEMALIGHASEESEGDGGRTTGLIIGAYMTTT